MRHLLFFTLVCAIEPLGVPCETNAQTLEVEPPAAIQIEGGSTGMASLEVDPLCDQSPFVTCDGHIPPKPHWLDPLDRLDDWFKSTRAEGGRWFLVEYDFDNRGYNVLHMMGHSPLPLGFSLWGFIDLEGAEGNVADREDISRHFLELDLKRKVWGNTGLVAELNDLEGQDNEIGRFGFFWQPDMSRFSPKSGALAGNFRLGFKCFPVQTIRDTSQWSFNWNKHFDNFLDARISAGGFFDLNLSPNREVIVTEHQVRFRVAEGLHLITEFRVNEFLADDFGIAPGVQYRF